MIDNCGRNIDYIRISVTDRCNLRCIYCMPEEGVESLSHTQILTFDEIVRICTVLSQKGLKKIKITGGEPLVRKNVASLVKQLKSIQGIENVTITTNGILLGEQYDALVAAGIDAITVSLDTLKADVYEKMTRRNQLEKVIAGLKMAIDKNKVPIKINCVPVFGEDKQDILSIVKLAKDNNIDVRFIEMMPIGVGASYNFVEEEKIKVLLQEKYGELKPYENRVGNGPAKYCTIKGFKGKIGFISAVSHKFCDSCNRIRLTADGFLKVCLQYDYGINLKLMLQENCIDEELLQKMLTAIEEKPVSHNFDKIKKFNGQEHKKMSQIGG